MKFKKLLLILLVIATVLSLASCGKKSDDHASTFIDVDGDGYCDKCERMSIPCLDSHGELNVQGYCKVCHFLSEDYANYKVEHKNHADNLHGDGLCDPDVPSRSRALLPQCCLPMRALPRQP